MTNFIMRLLGLGKAVDALDGETSKAYQGAAGLILAGAATAITGVAGILAEIVAAHGGAAYLGIARGIMTDASAALVLKGYAAIKGGIAIIGIRHAQAKAAAVEPPKP